MYVPRGEDVLGFDLRARVRGNESACTESLIALKGMGLASAACEEPKLRSEVGNNMRVLEGRSRDG